MAWPNQLKRKAPGGNVPPPSAPASRPGVYRNTGAANLPSVKKEDDDDAMPIDEEEEDSVDEKSSGDFEEIEEDFEEIEEDKFVKSSKAARAPSAKAARTSSGRHAKRQRK